MSSRFDQLPVMENNFFTQASSGLGTRLQPFDYTRDLERIQGYFYTPATSRFYYSEAQNKKRIVLHFTAGNLQSDMRQLTQDNYHVSVPFVIARDGKIYQLFYSRYWSHHLGMTSGNPGKIYDRQSIAIELCNYGWLRAEGRDLETIYSRQPNASTGRFNPVDIYCTLDDTEAYTRLQIPYREQHYYAGFAEAQLESAIVLVRYLTSLYLIPRDFLPEDQRFSTGKTQMDFNGIVSHVNYRSSGKWDIGPAFNWTALIDGVQAIRFAPVINPIRSSRGRPEAPSEKEFAPGKNKGSRYDSRKRTVIRPYDPFNDEQ